MLEDIINPSPARNLINKFYYRLPNNGYLNEGLLSCDRRYKEAITCAIVCVDEILENFGTLTEGKTHYCAYSTTKYYEQIKEELIQIQNEQNKTN
jgi:RNase P/RNase MRP subunit POP5